MATATQPQLGRPLAALGSLGVAPEDLAGVREIAQMLGVTRRTVERYIARDDFPAPLGEISAGRVWLRRDVEAWAKRMLPLRTGRPPKEEH